MAPHRSNKCSNFFLEKLIIDNITCIYLYKSQMTFIYKKS